jgi:hypothetical protein
VHKDSEAILRSSTPVTLINFWISSILWFFISMLRSIVAGTQQDIPLIETPSTDIVAIIKV